jgi:DNA-binding GntR family transcriptional regulator
MAMAAPPEASKQQEVFSVLRRRILDGTYPPGFRLVIDALARELEVSPMPVREAIRRLEAEHWVVHTRNVGAQVAPRDAEVWAEVIETLAVIEGYVTAMAARHMTADDFAAMRSLCDEAYADVDSLDVVKLTEHNDEFHRIIWNRCPNSILRRFVGAAQDQLTSMRSTIYFPMRVRGRDSIDEHLELIAMLEAKREPDEIERFARDHRQLVIKARSQSDEDK